MYVFVQRSECMCEIRRVSARDLYSMYWSFGPQLLQYWRWLNYPSLGLSGSMWLSVFKQNACINLYKYAYQCVCTWVENIDRHRCRKQIIQHMLTELNSCPEIKIDPSNSGKITTSKISSFHKKCNWCANHSAQHQQTHWVHVEVNWLQSSSTCMSLQHLLPAGGTDIPQSSEGPLCMVSVFAIHYLYKPSSLSIFCCRGRFELQRNTKVTMRSKRNHWMYRTSGYVLTCFHTPTENLWCSNWQEVTDYPLVCATW